MFSLDHKSAKLTSLNPRAEIHGEDRVPDADLKFEIKVGSEVLSEFHPSLRATLYQRPESPDLADDGESLTDIRFKLLGPLKWCAELAGYDATIHWGVSGKDDICLRECEVDGFRFDCQDGGTVVLSFRVIAHPNERDMGRLCALIQQEVELSLTEPKAEGIFDGSASAAHKALTEQGQQAAQRRSNGGAEVKYRDPKTGDTWTGRGRRPQWIEVAMLEGSNLEEFKVENQSAEA